MLRDKVEIGDHDRAVSKDHQTSAPTVVSKTRKSRKRPPIPATDHYEDENIFDGLVRQVEYQSTAEPEPICDDHTCLVKTQTCNVVASEPGQAHRVLHSNIAGLAPLIDELREQWRQRQAWHRAEKSLTLQAKALCRRLVAGDKKAAETLYKAALGKGEHPLSDQAFAAIMPLIEGRGAIERSRKAVEKRLQKLAKELPIKPVRGVGLLSIAALVGEAGAFTNYSTVAKLWKRMGLAVMGDGKRQRKIAGDAAIEHGYNPARRSVVWTIGDCIIKVGGPLKELYNDRKLYEADRVGTKMHAHNRAKRYIEKRLLKELWQAWRAAASEAAS